MNSDIDNVSVGNRIRIIRREKGLTTEEFSKIFTPPASKGTVSKWENGRYLPNNKRLTAIAEIANISVNELLYGSLDDYAKFLLDKLQDKLEVDESIDNIFIQPILNQAIHYLSPTRDYTPLEERFNNADQLKENFDNYIEKIIDGFRNIETREKNILLNLQSEVDESFSNAIEFMYASSYKDGSTPFTLGLNEAMSEGLYNDLINLQDEFFSKIDNLIEQYNK